MTDRTERLRKLVAVQGKLKALHETRHAGFLAGAAAAHREAEEIAARVDGDASMAALFPDLYNRRITSALSREAAGLKAANTEAALVATAKARGNMVDRAYRVESDKQERHAADRERLENASRKRGK